MFITWKWTTPFWPKYHWWILNELLQFLTVFKKKKPRYLKKKKPRCYIFDFKPLYKSANYLWCCTSSLETEYLVMFSSGSHVNWYCWTVKLHVFLFLFSFAKWAKYRFREIMFEKNLWLPFNVHCARVNTYIIKGTVFP